RDGRAGEDRRGPHHAGRRDTTRDAHTVNTVFEFGAATVLMLLSAAVFAVLGSLHLLYTFRGPKLTPRDPELRASMETISPVITRQTTMWRCWIGFNATHSMALLLYGLVYGYLAVAHPGLLFGSPYLLTVGLLVVGGCFALARAYFFSIPQLGTGVALSCYVASVIVSR
ncbi:MAG: hypothetical protein ABIW79_09425, partial [Gemmatimonas sp.]